MVDMCVKPCGPENWTVYFVQILVCVIIECLLRERAIFHTEFPIIGPEIIM